MHPGNVLLQWFSTIHPGHAKCVAHLYLICTARDMTPFFLDGQAILDAFSEEVLKEDMPVRVAANLASVGAVIDFIFHCTHGGGHGAFGEVASRYEGVTGQYGPLWRETAESWAEFIKQQFTPRHHVASMRDALAAQR